jgi:hypothetical protein
MELFNVALLAKDAPEEYFSDNTTLIPVMFLMNQENANKLDDEILPLQLLTCSKPMQSSAPHLSQKINSYNQIGPKCTKYTTTTSESVIFQVFPTQ